MPGCSYGLFGASEPRPALAAFAAAARFTDAPRYETGYVIDLALNATRSESGGGRGNDVVSASALHFRSSAGGADTLALWLNCGKPQCDTRHTVPVKLSISAAAVYNGFGRQARSALSFNASALPLYIAFPGEELPAVIAELRGQFQRRM
jgi:hypothetical protein